jgi:hypothetical protein
MFFRIPPEFHHREEEEEEEEEVGKGKREMGQRI